MSTAFEHYRNLLSRHYTWMVGIPFEDKVIVEKGVISKILGAFPGVLPNRGFAIDLGAGPGFQSVALAELGFSPVLAIDSSTELLGELEAHTGKHEIETRTADLSALAENADSRKAAVVVCMGDTLTHLPSKDAVKALFSTVAKRLLPRGVFLLTYRDLTSQLTGTDRFIPLRSEEGKIMTCFLEYDNPDTVVVTDLVHLRCDAGWTLEKSSYRKLRLSTEWVRNALTEAGFESQTHSEAGRLSLAVASID